MNGPNGLSALSPVYPKLRTFAGVGGRSLKAMERCALNMRGFSRGGLHIGAVFEPKHHVLQFHHVNVA